MGNWEACIHFQKSLEYPSNMINLYLFSFLCTVLSMSCYMYSNWHYLIYCLLFLLYLLQQLYTDVKLSFDYYKTSSPLRWEVTLKHCLIHEQAILRDRTASFSRPNYFACLPSPYTPVGLSSFKMLIVNVEAVVTILQAPSYMQVVLLQDEEAMLLKENVHSNSLFINCVSFRILIK